MDDYMALIRLVAFTFDTIDMMRCDGRILYIRDNSTLFALIGNTFGGDGINTFALPNMLGLEPDPKLRYVMVTAGLFPPRT